MFTTPQKVDRLLLVLRSLNGGVYLTAGFLTLPMPGSRDPMGRICERAMVNSVGRFQIATASFSRDTKYTRSFTAPVHAEGAGVSGMF